MVIRGYIRGNFLLFGDDFGVFIMDFDHIFYCTCSHPFNGASSRAWSATAGRAEGHCRRRAEGAEGDSHCIHPSTFLPGDGRWVMDFGCLRPGFRIWSNHDFWHQIFLWVSDPIMTFGMLNLDLYPVASVKQLISSAWISLELPVAQSQ